MFILLRTMTERLSIDIPPRKEKQESRADAVEVKGFVVSPNGLVSSLYPSERFVETLLRHGGMLNDGILGNGHAATVRLMHDAHGKQFAVKCCPPACYNECANELFVFSTVTSFTGLGFSVGLSLIFAQESWNVMECIFTKTLYA